MGVSLADRCGAALSASAPARVAAAVKGQGVAALEDALRAETNATAQTTKDKAAKLQPMPYIVAMAYAVCAKLDVDSVKSRRGWTTRSAAAAP